MSKLALCLSAARACLQMTVKSVARTLRVSDRVVTQLEQMADESDPRVAQLILMYEDLGLRFHRVDGEIVGVMPNDVKKVTLSAVRHANPEKSLQKLLIQMRHIGGLVYNMKSADKSKASMNDTIELHFPLPVRALVHDIFRVWNDTEAPFDILHPDGSRTRMNQENIESLL